MSGAEANRRLSSRVLGAFAWRLGETERVPEGPAPVRVADAAKDAAPAEDKGVDGDSSRDAVRKNLYRSVSLKNRVSAPDQVSVVDLRKCTGCAVCVETCTFSAIAIEKDRPVVEPARCTGCGACVAACPTEALSLRRR